MPHCNSLPLIRPPNIHVGRLIFYHEFFLSFFFFRQLPTELTERYSTIFGHMVRSKCNLKVHVRNLGYPFPLQIGGTKTPFRRLCNITANLMAYIFRMKHDIHKQASALQTTRGCKLQGGSYIVSKLWSSNGELSPTLHKFCIPLHC